jgi:putative chitinase
MSEFTANVLAKIAGKPVNSNMESVVKALYLAGQNAGLDKPHRLAHFLAQLAVETGLWKYDQEIWGPTAAQKRYDTRTDLGNTAAVDGDGERYKGRGPIQVTGRANYTKFDQWVRSNYKEMVTPDFVSRPDLINTDPWEGLSAIWFWQTHNINRYADVNNIEMVRRTINGGLNGFDDCVAYYTRCGLVLLGYGPSDVVKFQTDSNLKPDGIAGPATRHAIHLALSKLLPLTLGKPPVQPEVQPEPIASASAEELARKIYEVLKPYLKE